MSSAAFAGSHEGFNCFGHGYGVEDGTQVASFAYRPCGSPVELMLHHCLWVGHSAGGDMHA